MARANGESVFCAPALAALFLTGAFAQVAEHGPPEPGRTIVYEHDATGQLVYARSYEVAFEEAAQLYVQSGGTSEIQPGEDAAAVLDKFGTPLMWLPWAPLQQFLDQNFPWASEEEAGCAPCDEEAMVTWTIQCSGGCLFSCDYSDAGFLPTIVCMNDPPCPAGEICQPQPENITGVTLNQCPCECSSFSCVLVPGTMVTRTITDGPICKCEDVSHGGYPAMSEWQMAVMGLILLVSLALLHRSRTASTQASQANGCGDQ